ncbi:MAG: CD225/dispanin family protein [Nitriliruptorales bacterium]|nr:CD225/dispanin family protein [Nitriliruptorales bacterium]
MSDAGQAPPGWYDDPEQPGQLRYWDGNRWTEDRRPAGATHETSPTGYQTGGYGAGGASPPSTWLWQSIVATLFCCLPLGIVGIVFAAQAQSAVSAGNYAEAREKADKARTWTLVSVGVGLVAVLAWVAVVIFAGGFTEFQNF